jgi:glycosyltransferase involved in cell wall biosynthesis
MKNAGQNSQATTSSVASATAPTLAVLIPTLNRPRDLEIAIKTLLEQTRYPQELIIVDQSKTDESERCVHKLFAEHPKAAQIALRYTRDSRINGLTMARNFALNQTHCDVVLFLDDDVELEPDFVERLLEGYQEDPSVTGISGIITNYTAGTGGYRLWQALFVHGPFRDERQEIYHRADSLRAAGRIPVTRFGGGLMSFRASKIEGLQFDKNLRGACEGEDVDFCMHLPPGARLEIDPRARLVHNASPAARRVEHWSASVVRGTSYLYYRNWQSHSFAFAWLMMGFGMIALAAALKRGSLKPWQDFLAAFRHGKQVGLGKAPAA